NARARHGRVVTRLRRDDPPWQPRSRHRRSFAGYVFRTRLRRNYLRSFCARDLVHDPAQGSKECEIISGLLSAFAAVNAATTSAIHDVQRAFFDIERGFPDSFAQGRMRMSGASDVFGAAGEFNYRDRFGN